MLFCTYLNGIRAIWVPTSLGLIYSSIIFPLLHCVNNKNALTHYRNTHKQHMHTMICANRYAHKLMHDMLVTEYEYRMGNTGFEYQYHI